MKTSLFSSKGKIFALISAHACVYATRLCAHRGGEEGAGSPGAGVIGGCESPRGCWEWEPGFHTASSWSTGPLGCSVKILMHCVSTALPPHCAVLPLQHLLLHLVHL